jgi:hypothetical protein
MEGVLAPSSVPLALSAPFASSQGMTVRIVLTTKTYTGDPVAGKQILSLTANDGRSLTLGHDSQSWILGRTMNASPYNPILNALKPFWMTPWDPVYDAPEATVIVYYRISPTGVAYIDRFFPYFDSSGLLGLSWEEGVQLAAWSWGTVGIGSPTTNSPVPSAVTFSNAFLGATDGNDLIKSVRLKSASITVDEMFDDVISLVPTTQSLLSSGMKPCNDGLWLTSQMDGTPCGAFVTYTPSVGKELHYGPPANRTGYKTGRSRNFAPGSIGISPGLANGGLEFDWNDPGYANGYNYAVFDTTWNFLLDGGTMTGTSYSMTYFPGHSYSIYVAPYNDMGVGQTASVVDGSPPFGPWVQAKVGDGVRSIAMMSNGTIVAVGVDGFLKTKASVDADWVNQGSAGGNQSVAIMANGSILGIDSQNKMWLKQSFTSNWQTAYTGSVPNIQTIGTLPGGTIIGSDQNQQLWTLADLKSAWVKLPLANAAIQNATALPNGWILGVGTDGLLYLSANPVSSGSWTPIPGSGWVSDVAVAPNGRLIAIAGDGTLLTTDGLIGASQWTPIPNSANVSSVTQLPNGTLVGVDSIANSLKTASGPSTFAGWTSVPNSGAIIAITTLKDGSLLGIGTARDLYTAASPPNFSGWRKVQGNTGSVVSVAVLPDGTLVGVSNVTNDLWAGTLNIAPIHSRGGPKSPIAGP